MNDHAMLELVPLYALDAVDGAEKVAFESHLEDCAECQRALDEYQAVAAGLVPDQAPSELTWRRISGAISSEADVVGREGSSPGRTWRWVAGIAAAAAVVFGVALVNSLQGSDQLTTDRITSAAAEAAEEPGAFVGDFVVDDVAVAQVVLTEDGRGFVIPTDDLEPLEAARTYQLWVINDNEDVISAGVLGAAPAPATFTWTGDVSGFALTREVAGGVVSSEGDVVSVITGA